MLRALFVCFAIAVLAETILQAAGALAVAALGRQGVVAATNAFDDAAQRAQSAIAAAVAQGATPPSALPSPAPTCVLANGTSCSLLASESVTLTTPSPTVCPASSCAAYAQGNDAIAEGRVVATIEAQVSNAAGATIAARGGSIVFRTMRFAPYAVPAGTLDATLDENESGAGDAAGIVPGASSSGTLIDVVYENASSGALMPANVWNGLAASATSATGWSP